MKLAVHILVVNSLQIRHNSLLSSSALPAVVGKELFTPRITKIVLKQNVLSLGCM